MPPIQQAYVLPTSLPASLMLLCRQAGCRYGMQSRLLRCGLRSHFSSMH